MFWIILDAIRCHQNPFNLIGSQLDPFGLHWIHFLVWMLGDVWKWKSVGWDFPIWKPSSASACLSFHKSFFIGATPLPPSSIPSLSEISEISLIPQHTLLPQSNQIQPWASCWGQLSTVKMVDVPTCFFFLVNLVWEAFRQISTVPFI